MKRAKIYTIRSANPAHDGDTVAAYSHADALRVTRKYIGTQLGGTRTRVLFSHVLCDIGDLYDAYLDAR